jgi:hypothetical protein
VTANDVTTNDVTTNDGDTDASGGDATTNDAGTDSPTESGGDASEGGVADTGTDADLDAADDAVSDSGMDSENDAGTDAADSGNCPDPDLTDTERNLFVDQTAPAGGNGSLACPFRTILAATAVARTAPIGSALTIHVKGANGGATYDEAGPVLIGARATLTSAYELSLPDPTTVIVRAQGTCGGGRCVVSLTDATLQGITVAMPNGAGNLNGIFANGASTIEHSTASGFSVIGIVAAGASTVGPGVFANDNASDGLRVTMAANGPGAGPLFKMPGGGRGNRFNGNGGHGIHVLDRYGQAEIVEATTNNNSSVGIFIEAEANSSHSLKNITANNNDTAGVRIPRGPAIVNGSFNSNGIHGIYFGNGTDSGAVFGITSSEANKNGGDGARLDTANFVQIDTFTARANGQNPGNLGGGSGVYVAQGTTLQMRKAVLLENTVGLYFSQKRTAGGPLTTLDIGGGVNDDGGNTFGATPTTSNNSKAGLCILQSGASASQKAYGNSWTTCPIVQSLLPSSGTPDCYDANSYADVIYLPFTAGNTNPVTTGGTTAPACNVGSP